MHSPDALVTALETLASRLTEAGVSATVDPTAITVPGAWVTVERLTPTTLDGRMEITAAVILVAPDHGHTTALAQLGWMLDAAAGAVPALSSATPEISQLPGIPGQLPSLKFTVDLD